MQKNILAATAMVAAISTSAQAQPVLEESDLVIRPGDRIIWSGPPGEHSVQFGGLAVLTTLADAGKVLEFTPKLTVSTVAAGDQGVSAAGGDPMLTATVKADATPQGVPAVTFTCGIHRGQMRSKPFKVTAASPADTPREIRIHPDPNGNNWVMEKSGGGVIIDASAAAPRGSHHANAHQ
jgi:hypothetical protein